MIAAIIIAGVLLRLNGYLVNRSFWPDEAVLALNIINKNIPDFINKLDYNEFSPFGFLTIEKIVINFFGNSEYSLRLLPLIFGLLSIFLFYKLSKKFLSPKLYLFTVSLFAFSRSLIFFSSELKSYSLDVFITITLLLLAQSKHTLLLLIFGALSVWFSYPAIFIIASIIIYKLLSSPKKIDFFIIFSWISSFLVYFFISIQKIQNQPENIEWQTYWQTSFASLNPFWYLKTFFTIFENPLDLFFPIIGATAYLIGSLSFFKKNKKAFFLLTAPGLFALFASFLHLYPFSDRFLLFLVPSLIVIIAKGVETLSKLTPTLFYLSIILILLPQIFLSLKTLVSPVLIEETRPLISFWKENRQKDDLIYVYYGSDGPFKYYAPSESAIFGLNSRDNPALYENDLEKLKGNSRVWLLFSHVYNNEEEFMLSRLEKMGKKIKDFYAPGASLYLYNLMP